MSITSYNPANGKKIKTYQTLQSNDLEIAINNSYDAFIKYRGSSLNSRKKWLLRTAEILRTKKDIFSKIITQEMGKRLIESVAEVEKCAWVCEYYAENGESFLKNKMVKTDAVNSFVQFEPLGIVFIVMPWNFPFWQVFRAAVPALMAGNTVLLKHASSVPQSALEIQDIFIEAEFPKDSFQTLLIQSDLVANVISNFKVKAVSLTGSEAAGISVAQLAGKYLKKSVLELGGSDPFIVLDDANIDAAIQAAVQSRLIVSGQSCIAAKRFLVQESIFDAFISRFKENLEKKRVGDPMEQTTDVGPLSSQQILETIDMQVKRSVEMGARVLTGGKPILKKGYYYPPTLLTNVDESMPVFNEETFGPVACILPFRNDSEAIRLANNSKFGLAASVWTNDEKRKAMYISQIEAGAVFINSIVKSDPRLPFGGTKMSGYGKELSEYGMREFVNIKSVWIQS